MLRSALLSSSESVFVDLLTYSDLEALKSLRNSKSKQKEKDEKVIPSLSSSTTGVNKRYLILTYTGEFDRVHYPIPLNFETEPDMMTLQRTCLRLRDELKALRTYKGQNNIQRTTQLHVRSTSIGRENELASEVRRLKEENTSLKSQIRKYENDSNDEDKIKLESANHDREILQRELKATRKERDFLKDKLEETSMELVRKRSLILCWIMVIF